VFITELGQQTHCFLLSCCLFSCFYLCLSFDVETLTETLQTFKTSHITFKNKDARISLFEQRMLTAELQGKLIAQQEEAKARE